MPRFKHPPLASATEEIRLLSLDLGGDLDDIHCTLETHRLETRPLYCALSYEWGDPNLPVDIKVNGNVFHARHNLWLFLHRLKSARRAQSKNPIGPASKLWIDALCIDQTDLAERGAQVQLMRRIYREAVGVIVWLGWSDGLDPKVTLKLARLLASDPDSVRNDCAALLLSGPYQHTNTQEEVSTLEISVFILELCKKTYWTRRWIVQEIVVAQNVLLVYGRQKLPWAAVCMMFRRYQSYTESQFNGSNPPFLWEIRLSTAAKIWSYQANMTTGQNPIRQWKSLANLLRDYRTLQCEVFHDKVYSLKSLLMGVTLDTDYSISASELFSRVFTIILQQDHEAFQDWHFLATECGLTVKRLELLDLSAHRHLITTPVPLRTACNAYVIRTMGFTIFEEGVKKLEAQLAGFMKASSINRKDSCFKQGSKYVSDLGRTLKALRGVTQHVLDFLRTKIAHVNSGIDMREGYGDRSIESKTRWLIPATVETGSANLDCSVPLMIFCRTSPGSCSESYLCVTWSNVNVGDFLCQIVGHCYLIIRRSGIYLQIVGPAWILFHRHKTRTLQQFFSEFEKSADWKYDDSRNWKELFEGFPASLDFAELQFQDGFWDSIEMRSVEIQFDVMELILLLQLDAQMRGVLRSTDWISPNQSLNVAGRQSN